MLRSEGGEGLSDPSSVLPHLALSPAWLSEYVEVHMEQGPVLEAAGLPLGVVAGIAGQARLWVTVTGEQVGAWGGRAGAGGGVERRHPQCGATVLHAGAGARPWRQGSRESEIACTPVYFTRFHCLCTTELPHTGISARTSLCVRVATCA